MSFLYFSSQVEVQHTPSSVRTHSVTILKSYETFALNPEQEPKSGGGAAFHLTVPYQLRPFREQDRPGRRGCFCFGLRVQSLIEDFGSCLRRGVAVAVVAVRLMIHALPIIIRNIP